MIRYSKRHFTCGEYVEGHGRHVLAVGEERLPGEDWVIKKGVITKMPSKLGEPYQVLDEQSFGVFEIFEEHLRTSSFE